MKILISQTASLGDVILSTPVISTLRRTYPEAQLWFLGGAAGCELLAGVPRLAGTISFDKNGRDSGLRGLIQKSRKLRSFRFDRVYAIQRSARVSILLALSSIPERIGFKSSSLPFLFTSTAVRRKAKHEVERNLSIISDQIGVTQDDMELRLYAPGENSISAEIRDALTAPRPLIAIFPGSLWYTKRWAPENFIKLASKLVASGIRPIFLGAAKEKAMVDQCAAESGCSSLAGRTSLQDLLYIISRSNVVVCNDSSALHIAAAFKTPTVAIFCATTPQLGFGPWRNPKSVIMEEKDLWCRPCSRHGGQYCPTGTELCMRGTTEEEGVGAESVYRAAMKLSGYLK